MLPLWGRDPGSFFNSRDHRPFPRPVPLNEVLLCYTLSCMSWVTVKLVWAIVPKERPPMTQSGGAQPPKRPIAEALFSAFVIPDVRRVSMVGRAGQTDENGPLQIF